MKNFSKKDLWIIFLVVLFSIAAIWGPRQFQKYLYYEYQGNYLKNYEKNIPDGWNAVKINDLGMIAIPSSLEVRESGSNIDIINKVGKEILYKSAGLSETQSEINMVIQPKGLNEENISAFSSYARIMINVYKVDDNSLPNRWQHLNLSESDRLDIKNDSINSLKEASKSLGCDIKDTSFDVVVVNRMSATRFDYIRSCRGNPEVLASQYKFYDKRRIVEIILSYRINESQKYRDDFSKIINSFIISN